MNLSAADLLPEPVIGNLPEADKLELNRSLDAYLAKAETLRLDGLREQETRLNAERDAQLVLAKREQASAVIKAHIEGIPADGAMNFTAREKLQDLRLSALTGTDENKDAAWHLQTAAEIVRLHQEERRTGGGDGSQRLPQMGLSEAAPGNPFGRGYSVDRLLLSLADDVKRQGVGFDTEKFTGSPEAELTKDLLAQPFAAAMYAELTAEARPNQRIVPVPAAVLRNDMNLAETYAEAVATATATASPDYRRDLLVDFFRPTDRLPFLGVMQETISNNVMFSRVSGAPVASWRNENQAAVETQLTLATQGTEPHRLTTYDDVSWMRLVSADRDFGVQPMVSQELMRACRQARENGVYQGTGTNPEPNGLLNVTGVLAGVIGGAAGNTAPTLAEIIGMIVDIADGNVDISMLRWLTTWAAGGRLATLLTFAASSSVYAVPLYRNSDLGVGMGTINNHPAALTTQLPVNLNSGSETDDDEHAIIAGVWPYQVVFDYATMFITIDDITGAINGRTRMTVNSYHDTGTRVPQAFSAGEFKPS